MASFIVKYNIYIGDTVAFNDDGIRRQGIVQDISHISDIFVEGYNNKNEYTRWKLGINSLEVIYSDHEDAGKWFDFEIGKKEPVEFVHGKNFYDLIYKYKIIVK